MSEGFILVSDIHMRNNLPHVEKYDENGQSDRINDQMGLWMLIGRVAEERKAKGILVLGDLYDENKPDAVTLTVTAQCIANMPCPTYLLGGNHEGQTEDGDRFVSESLATSGSVRYISSSACKNGFGFSTKSSGPRLVFWPMEFCPTDRAKRILKRYRKALDPKDTNVLLMHHSIVGCTHYGWKCDVGLDPNLVCEGFDFVYTGHFHDSQTFGPGQKGRYLGAPLHLKLDDAGREAGFWFVSFGHKERTEELIDGGAPRFHVLNWPLKPGDLKGIDGRRHDFVRIKVECTKPKWDKIRDKVSRVVEAMRAKGLRAKYNFKPVYHHEERLGFERMVVKDLDGMIESYVELDSVKKDGLDEKRLINIGREIMQEAAERG
jgi:DNA repair exonuclease SbcCD nuclease subunit